MAGHQFLHRPRRHWGRLGRAHGSYCVRVWIVCVESRDERGRIRADGSRPSSRSLACCRRVRQSARFLRAEWVMWPGHPMWKSVRVKIGADARMSKTHDFLAVIVGIAGLSILFGFASFAVIGSSDIGAGVLSGGVGVALALLAWLYWFSRRWVRVVLAGSRSSGHMAWIIQADSAGGFRHRLGVLDVDENAVSITIKEGTVRTEWSELEPILFQERESRHGARILLKGPQSGSVELEVMQDNAVISLREKQAFSCFLLLQSIEQVSRVDTEAGGYGEA